MALDSMFTYQEQEKIKEQVKTVKAQYLKDHIPIRQRHHFSDIADRYNLSQRIINQFQAYQKGRITADSITFNVEISELFEVDRANVTRYLQRRINLLIYKQREHLCRSISGERGGRNGSNKGHKHKKTWSRKKKKK